jgi:hypothetical protein
VRAKSLDFSGQIVHCDLARKHARVRSLLRRHRQTKSWRRFHLNIETLLMSVSHLHCLTQRQHVPLAVRVTIHPYTNSRLETGVQPAKSDIDETDVFSDNP